MASYTFKVNNVSKTVTVADGNMPLLWVLRDILGLTGTKYGCGIEKCFACTILINGQPEHACVFNVSSAAGKNILTIEALEMGLNDPDLEKVKKVWIDHQVPQCGYCQCGMIMAVTGAVKAGHHGKEILPEIKNICVCGTYQRIREAISDSTAQL